MLLLTTRAQDFSIPKILATLADTRALELFPRGYYVFLFLRAWFYFSVASQTLPYVWHFYFFK